MSIETLANKHRPQVFEDFLGQEVNVQFLSSLIKGGQQAKNIIFHGPFGSSKTTSLRVFSRALNCLQPSLSGSPCNSCENCQLFFQDQFSDYLEIDAATNGDKDSIKNLRNIAHAPPMLGKYRIIALDEVQQVSKAGWDALLELTENTPPQTCFLFSTTEYGKVPETIKSRCFGLEVKLLSEDNSLKLLDRVAKAEGLNSDSQALRVISHMSKGHPRDLIKNLEQISCFGDVNLSNIKNVFNFGEYLKIQELIKLLILESKPNFHSFLKTWFVSLQEMQEVLQSFFLHLNYKYVYSLEVEVHPAFNLLDPALMISVKNKISSLPGGFEENLNKILGALSDLNNNNLISFEISLNNLFRKIHEKALKETGSVEVKKEVSTPKRRWAFASENSKKETLPVDQKSDSIPVVQEKSSLDLNQKLNKLKELGFSPLPKDVIIEEIKIQTSGASAE